MSSIQEFARFLEDAERSPNTIKNYVVDLHSFDRWFREANGDGAEPERITSTDLREYKRFLIEERKLRPNSINRKLATLRSFLSWAANTGLLPDARAPTVPRAVRQARPGPRWLDRREQMSLERIVERGGRVRDIAIVRLLMNTGLRARELCLLHWRDVTCRPRKGTVVVQGKGDKVRVVPLNKDARKALMSLGFETNAGKDEPIFLGQRGPLTPRGVQILFGKYAKAAGLENATPHSLRHTFCKNLINAGANLEEVAALAGHENLETTRRYCEPSILDLQRTVALIEKDS